MLLKLADLSYSYDDGFTVNLPKLELELGQIACLCGVSGSGKSTLLECVGLLHQHVNIKHFEFNGHELDLNDRALCELLRSSLMAFMPQNSVLLPFLNVEENISYQIDLVLANRKKYRALSSIDLSFDKKQRLSYLQEYIERLDLQDKLSNKPHELSLGQRQRASFIKALAAKPYLMLIDEPSSALDRHNAHTIFAAIHQMVEDKSMAALVVTHDLSLVQDMTCYEQVECDGASSFVRSKC